MQVSALLLAIASALLFALLCAVVFVLLCRFHIRGVALALVGFLLFVTAVAVPPPLLLLARAGMFDVTEPGHAFSNFVLPYVGLSLTCVVATLVFARRRNSRQ